MSITVDSEGSPIKVTGTTESDEEILASNQKAYIKFIYWYKPTTTGHLVTLTDGQGKEIITMRAEADNGSQQWDIDTQYYGIRTSDMDSGTLYIYVR